jgi:hypothetical protein
MSTKPPPREQEQTIRSRKQLLFDADEPVVTDDGPSKPRKSFAEYVRETPASPLTGMAKAGLWGAGAIVLLLLVITIMKTSGGSAPKPSTPGHGSISQPLWTLA